MKKFLFALLCLLPLSAPAELRIFACEPEWASLAQELAGERARIFAATTAQQDPHHIQARPSLIARVRQADLLVCTGAGLESGWLPLLLRQANNPRLQPGQPGYFEAAGFVVLREVPTRLDRADGDVHPDGNPHLHLDPANIRLVAEALAQRLATLDPAGAEHYRVRQADFLSRWGAAVQRWRAEAAPLKGMPVVVGHRQWSYLSAWLGLETVAELEPKPGIPPGSGHLAEVLRIAAEKRPRAVLYAPYQDPRGARWLSERAGIPALALPYTVGGTPAARDLFGLYQDSIERLLEAAR